MSKDQHPDWT